MNETNEINEIKNECEITEEEKRFPYFEKVTEQQYIKDCENVFGCEGEGFKKIQLKDEWNNIRLPKRASRGSGGYDIECPFLGVEVKLSKFSNKIF